MPDNAFLSEEEWDDLLEAIQMREVIPIVGCGAITAPETGEKFTAWLGKRLAANLQVPDDKIRSPREVNEVIGAYYRGHHGGGELTYDIVKSRIKRIISDNRLPPAEHLVDLARIKHFDLFLTTSYDFMLQSALEQVRTPSKIRPINIWNTNNVPELDLPDNWHASGTILAYLLGSCEKSPNFAPSDADIIDDVLALSSAMKLKQKTLPNLARALTDKKLLLLGMNFDDWLTRFFIHVARTQTWHQGVDRGAYIADNVTDSLVIFIQGTRKTMQFIEGQPSVFVSELSRRCIARFGEYEAVVSSPHSVAAGQASGKVFISYANPEDKMAAEKLRDLLEEFGCDVWWFPGEAKAGDKYDPLIEMCIMKKTSVFISVVSKTTVSQYGKYFHKERDWARATARGFRDVPFYLPVVVDADVSQEDVDITEILRDPKPQTERFPGGAATPEFCSQVFNLQRKFRQRPVSG